VLGTDKLGRDVFSRMVYGARTSMLAALEAVSISIVLGLPFGLLAGYHGGRLDSLFSRTNEGIMSVPGITLALAVIAVLGPGIGNAMLAVGITFAPQVFRVTRAATIEIRETTFIEASRALGCSRFRIIFSHVLPNTFSPLLVVISVSLGLAVLVEGGLSFIGVGVTAPTPSWGSMLFEARQRLDLGYLVYAPGIVLTITIAAFTTLGDSIRDAIGVSRAGDA
jgi:ABC-type dipeptide/oligopeptide/nickel transport system permease subunit